MYAIISHNDSTYQPLADITWNQNKLPYALDHGYVYYNRTDGFRTGQNMMTGFEKIYIARDILVMAPEIEWVWWTGTDTMITNRTVKIEDKIDNNYHFMICVDVNGINADSFLVRNSKQGLDFLDHVLSLESECMKFWDTEQRAIDYACGFPGTNEPGWGFGETVKVCDQYQNVVRLLPQRYMNSFNYSLYHYTDHRDKLGVNGNWQSGDWLIHWPGTNLQLRLQLASAYLKHVIL